MQADLIADCGCEVGEVPMWHPSENKLYWTDIPAGKLYRYDPASDTYEECFDDGVVGGYTIQEDGTFLLFMEQGAVRTWDGEALETIVDRIPGEESSRFNDVISDPEGRVFGGTMPTDDQLGSVYRIDTDGSVTELLDSVDLPNGMGFTPDRETLYLTESYEDTIYTFDYDAETGSIDNRSVFVDASEDEGMPDGLTVDSDGYVWSAKFGGGCVVRYDPSGTEVERYEIPAENVTSLLFAGESFKDLYVTTAKFEASDGDIHAGDLFRLRPGVGGVEEFYSNVSV